MRIKSLGHVVLKVSDLERSERFYTDVLGMQVCARLNDPRYHMIFFSLGNHHELALLEVSGGERPDERAVGLHHAAFCIGDAIDQLVEARTHLESAGVACQPVDHDVTKSLYFTDPDGNMLEVYVDLSDGWRQEPQRIATVAPLEL